MTVDGNAVKDEFKNLVEELKKENFSENGKLSVVLKDGNLIINGKQQPEAMLEKLQPFLKDKKKVNFSIDINEK